MPESPAKKLLKMRYRTRSFQNFIPEFHPRMVFPEPITVQPFEERPDPLPIDLEVYNVLRANFRGPIVPPMFLAARDQERRQLEAGEYTKNAPVLNNQTAQFDLDLTVARTNSPLGLQDKLGHPVREFAIENIIPAGTTLQVRFNSAGAALETFGAGESIDYYIEEAYITNPALGVGSTAEILCRWFQ